MRYIDAHNHLQDPRFGDRTTSLAAECAEQGILFSVVNGCSPEDWPRVASLAENYPWVIPNFGVHPWYIEQAGRDWESLLSNFLDRIPSGVGEVGIDGWRKELNQELQEDIFKRHVAIAAERNLPLSIHGLRKWGRLLELLRATPLPSCGFLLHSYGGPAEMIPAFVKLGGYFSCPGFFLGPGKEKKLSLFQHVPSNRLLIETDAPDQNLPPDCDPYQLASTLDGVRINHPCTISAVYSGLASHLRWDLEELAATVEQNFKTLFAPILQAQLRDFPCSSV